MFAYGVRSELLVSIGGQFEGLRQWSGQQSASRFCVFLINTVSTTTSRPAATATPLTYSRMGDKYIVQFTGLNQLHLAGLGQDSDRRAVRRLRYSEYREIFEELTASMIRLFKFSNATVRPWEASHNHLIEFSGKRALLVTSIRYSAEQMKSDIERGITGFFFIRLPFICLPKATLTEIAELYGLLFLEQPLPREVYIPAQTQESSLSNAAFILNKSDEDESDKDNVGSHSLEKLARNNLLKACLNRALNYGKIFVRQIMCILANNLISGFKLM